MYGIKNVSFQKIKILKICLIPFFCIIENMENKTRIPLNSDSTETVFSVFRKNCFLKQI